MKPQRKFAPEGAGVSPNNHKDKMLNVSGETSDFSRLFSLSLPLFTGVLLTHLITLLTTLFVGHSEGSGFFFTGLFLPFGFLITAIIEGMRAPTVVRAARGDHTTRNIRFEVLGFAVLGMGLLWFFGGGMAVIADFVYGSLGGAENLRFRGQMFILAMLASSAFTVAGVVMNTALFALSLGRIALTLSIAANLLNCGVTFFTAFFLGYGIFGAAFGLFFSGTFLGGAAFYFLPVFSGARSSLREGLRVFLELFWKISLPVLGSYLLLCLYFLGMNHILLAYGEGVVAGFGLASRLQTVLMLPAIALGTGQAILTGQLLGKNADVSRIRRMIGGAVLALILGYACVGGILFFFKTPISLFLLGQGSGESAKFAFQSYLQTIGLSYVFFAPLLSLLICLDQIGRGGVSFVCNLFSLGLALGAAFYVSTHGYGIETLFLSTALSNVFSALILFVTVARLSFDQTENKEHLEKSPRVSREEETVLC